MPNSPRPVADYHARLQRVSDHIHDNLAEPLNLAQLAELGCLSPCHWHRIYASFFGETMAATVKRLRLQRAAGDLALTDMPVGQVAKRSGYPNVQSFTRTFSVAYGLPPMQYRTRGQHAQFQAALPGHVDGAFDVRVVLIDPIRVVGRPHQGSYMAIGKAFTALLAWLGAHDGCGTGSQNVSGLGPRCIGIYFDDPFAVAQDQLHSLACVAALLPDGSSLDGVAIKAPLLCTTVAGGRYAVLRYQGPYASMHAAYQWLFGHWLLQSGEQAADSPVFEDYLNSPVDTAPADLRTDIYMPLSG